MLLDVLSSAALIIFYSDTSQIKLKKIQFVLKFIKMRIESEIYHTLVVQRLYSWVVQFYRSFDHTCIFVTFGTSFCNFKYCLKC